MRLELSPKNVINGEKDERNGLRLGITVLLTAGLVYDVWIADHSVREIFLIGGLGFFEIVRQRFIANERMLKVETEEERRRQALNRRGKELWGQSVHRH